MKEEAPVEIPAVLLVDDDPRNLVALESILADGDFSIVKAQTGDQALLALMEKDFAAIVLDVQMPEVSGIDLAKLIKQRKRTQHIPIIFLTAHYREEEHAVMAYDVGAVDYLTKPINPAVLRSKVNVFVELFQKTRALSRLNARLESQNFSLQREAEERMRRIEAESAQAEAEAANAAKDRFLAMLSHELRTPLTPIVYAVSSLEKDASIPAHAREALEVIERNVWLEARLIDDLLDLARIRSGKLTLQLQAGDVHDVLQEAIRTCMSEFDRRAVRLVCQLEAQTTSLRTDPARLQQIFWNLLSNAAKFTPSGGTITVRTVNLPESGTLQVEICDTGIGIDPQKLDRIFDAFEQGARSSSAGLGLGLAICKALVELHDGAITAWSDGPGSGATFTLQFPVAAEPLSTEKPAAPELPAVANIRILLVEDHSDTAETLQRLLARRGYEVRIAGSVAEALEAFEGQDFDVLVSDIGLPDGRGTDLLVQLRARSGRPVRAIAMSGFGTEDDLERSRDAGFSQHLTKPVDYYALEQAIARLASNPSVPVAS